MREHASGSIHADGAAVIEVSSFELPCGMEEETICGSGKSSVVVFRRDWELLRRLLSSTSTEPVPPCSAPGAEALIMGLTAVRQ